ncbi:serine/threonine-protein kinase [Streptomyces sp. NPDC095613]|uniref:serine/threonine-protein kinase n=1 Tax=Streptomyces sp. NPDC095613 TaxID=3155540 RepID=UPI00332F85EF
MGTSTGPVLAGRYRLGEAIGSGGMGKVWRAHDEVLHRVVAIKELTAGNYVSEADRAVLHRRTRTEARAAARITHPGVVTVHDVLDHDDRPWIVMQYVDGPSLADTIKASGPLAVHEAARIGLETLDALRAAHAAGVLHRDVKPGNVLLERGSRVLLTDFGIAAIEGDSTLTRTGELIGSIDYLAPERVRGSDPGPASDLWSLGVTLYTAVQGNSPFRRTSPLSTMQAVVAEEVHRPERAGPLTPVIDALLAKEPQDRPEADEAERMLRGVLEGRAESAEATTHARTRVLPDSDRLSSPADAQAPTDAQAPSPAQAPADAGAGAGAGTGLGAGVGAGTVPPGPMPSAPLPAGYHQPGQGQGPGEPRALGPHGAREPERDRRRDRRRRTIVAVVVAALLGSGAGYAALQYSNGGGGSEENVTDTGGGTGNGGTSGDDTTADDRTSGGTDHGDTGGSPGDTVAEGWQRVEAPEGFSMSVPKGWERLTDSEQIDYSPDNGLHLIRISIGPPDFETPYQHLQSMEQGVLKRLPQYERLELAPNDFRDMKLSARWEFTWNATAAPIERRAIDQVYYSDDSATEYAIYMAGPAEDWTETRKQFDAVLRSWQPPPSDAAR